jgi:anti-anti-sigma factor
LTVGARESVFSVDVIWLGTTTAVVFVHGDLDIVTAPLLQDFLAAAVARGPERLVLDLAETTLLDVAGAREIEHAYDMLSIDGGTCQFILRQPRPIVRTVLEIVGLDRSCAIEH